MLRELKSRAVHGRIGPHGSDNSRQDGMSLVEVMVTLLILSIVLAITTPAVTMFFDVNGDVQNTYLSLNQVTLASEVVTQYLHEAIAPCPATNPTNGNANTETGCSLYAFSSTPTPSYSSLTFYADDNAALGPEKIVLSTTGKTFTAVTYQPTGSCPFNSSVTTMCTYSTTAHLLTTVSSLTNASVTAVPTTSSGTWPILSYDTTAGSNACNTTTPTVSAIQAVCITLQSSVKGGEPTGYQATAFALASSYNGSVG